MSDFLLHVGGSVWALDWCPRRLGWPRKHGTINEFLAVGTHPDSAPTHILGEPVYGRGLIQIWAFSFPSSSETQGIVNTWKHGRKRKNTGGRGLRMSDPQSSTKRGLNMTLEQGTGSDETLFLESIRPEEMLREKEVNRTADFNKLNLPQMVLGLAHEGGVTWDIKWQPATASSFTDRKDEMRLGYLAVLFGDGSVQVFDVPLPTTIKYPGVLDNSTSSIEPLVIKIDPVFRCSGLPYGGHKSIPFTCEWSTWAPHDNLLVGFHDGTVALWRFCTQASPSQDTRPFLCFVADSAPIRAVAWAPDDSGTESRNMVATAGHTGTLRFWDIREPFHSVWDLVISRGFILSLDWIPDPRCVILSMDDGTLRLLSLNVAANDTPVTGKVCTKTQFQGFHSYMCTSFAIWAVQVSRATGLVAYGGEDGSVKLFQLTEKAVEKEAMRYKEPHYLCGAFNQSLEDGTFLIISQRAPAPVQMKRSSTEWSQTPVSRRRFARSSSKHGISSAERGKQSIGKREHRRHSSRSLSLSVNLGDCNPYDVGKSRQKCAAKVSMKDSSMVLVPFGEQTYGTGGCSDLTIFGEEPVSAEASHAKKEDKQDKRGISQLRGGRKRDCLGLASVEGDMAISEEQEVDEQGKNMDNSGRSSGCVKSVERFPAHCVAVHRVRWNCNSGSERWLCYGGAGGIVRCQFIHNLHLIN